MFFIGKNSSSLVLLFLIYVVPSLGTVNAAPVETKVLNPAQSAFEKQDYDQVISLLAPKLEKLSKKQVFLLGLAYEKKDNGLAAIKAYRTLLSKNEKDVEAMLYIANANSKMGKEDDAISLLKDALTINKRFEAGYFALAELYKKKGNRYALRLLVEDLEKFVSPSKKPQVVADLCEINLKDGFHAQAKLKCTEAIQLNPKNPSNYVNLGIALKETGDAKGAVTQLHRAADSFKTSESAQFALGEHYTEEKNHVKAYQYYKKAVEADPKSGRSLVALGFAAIELQKFGEALSALSRACELDHTNEKHLRRGATLLRQVKALDWEPKFDAAIEKCGGSGFQ